MSSVVEQIKHKLSLVDVVGQYLKLEKAGINYKARCPFHHEKTPSFFISPARDSFYCFGCNKGGDIFTFVEEIEGLDFVGALRVLAERAGVPLTRDHYQGEVDNRGAVYRGLELATRFYEQKLGQQAEVINYLTERGVSPESIKAFRLGYAPNLWRSVSDLLQREHLPEKVIEETGLVIKNYDRFRGRIMFPLIDPAGRVVGFSGRIFGVADDGQAAKYINSPKTLVYNKSKFLYGFNRAKLAVRQQDQVVLVEGQMDLILSQQAGLLNTVAVSGTALTAEHLELLKRQTNKVIMAFDGDWAGINASRRAVELALGLDLELKVALLPAGVDPADLIKQDPTAWLKAIEEAVHVIDFALRAVINSGVAGRDLAHAIRKEVYPYIAILPQRIDQAHFINQVVAATGLPEEVVRSDIRDLAASRHQSRSRPDGRVRDNVGGETLATNHSRVEILARRIRGLARFQTWPAAKWQGVFTDTGTTALLNRIEQDKDEAAVLEAEISYQGLAPDLVEKEWSNLVTDYRREVWRGELNQRLKELGELERAGKWAEAEAVIKLCRELANQLGGL